MIFSSIGVISGLLLWIVWPRMLPRDFRLSGPDVPRNDKEAFRSRMRPRLSRWYRAFINLPVPYYLIAAVAGMLAGPSAVAFVPILIAWILLFEPLPFRQKAVRLVLPAAAITGIVWIFQSYWLLRLEGGGRIPWLPWLFTQPWVIVRYFYSFFLPFRLVAVPDLTPFSAPWKPLALVGFAGLGALVWLARAAARIPGWRAVSFGLWWFLLALLPLALVPQPEAEAFPRAFLAYAGLVLAVTRAAFILLESLRQSVPNGAPSTAAAVLAVLLLGICGWQTWQRNEVWRSDETLWGDVLARNPNDAHALMHYALLFMDPAQNDIFATRYAIGLDYLKRAAALLPDDPAIETQLGIASEQTGRDADAEKHLRRAISLGPEDAGAWAAWSAWLLTHGRTDEAFTAATRAGQLNSVDIDGRRTLADIYVGRGDWTKAVRVAGEVLQLNPDDPGAQRSLHVAQSGIAAADHSLNLARTTPSVDNFLSLSVVYYQQHKYAESVQAAKDALKLRPDAAEAYVNMAAAWHALGNEAETIAALRQALRIKPDFQIAQRNLAFELSGNPASQSR